MYIDSSADSAAEAGERSWRIEKSGAASDGASRSRQVGERASGLDWTPLMSIAAAAFAVEIPFFFLGTPSGHDVEFHLYSWLEVLSQWKQGIVYPRWAALAHFAYGEPRFIFYPPASWTLGAALSAIFPWMLVSRNLTSGWRWWRRASPCSCWRGSGLTAERNLRRRLYAVNPYHLVIVYWRSAFAELLAASLLPLLLLLIVCGDEKGQRVTSCWRCFWRPRG